MKSALDMQRSRASSIARELAARAPAGSITCVFAGGSLGRGEVFASARDGGIEVYSDVDLYVVVDSAASLDAVRAATAGLQDIPLEGARFLRPADIGVYTRDDLRAQPARPGTVDLSRHILMLHGDESIPRGLPPAGQRRIDVSEALYLLEHRALELDATSRDETGPAARMARVRALKARLDVHVAHAIVDGSFVPTLAERASVLESRPPSTLDEGAREDVAAAYHAMRALDAWLDEGNARDELERAMAAISRAWGALAPAVLGAPGEPVERLLARRWRSGARMANARELVRLRRAFGRPLWLAVEAATRLSYRSPRAALRLDALVRRFHAEGRIDAAACEGHRRGLDALTRAYGFAVGPQEKRAREMYRMIS